MGSQSFLNSTEFLADLAFNILRNLDLDMLKLVCFFRLKLLFDNDPAAPKNEVQKRSKKDSHTIFIRLILNPGGLGL